MCLKVVFLHLYFGDLYIFRRRINAKYFLVLNKKEKNKILNNFFCPVKRKLESFYFGIFIREIFCDFNLVCACVRMLLKWQIF